MAEGDYTAPAVPERIDFARGDMTGLLVPQHPEALVEAGAAFLTAAFHAYGSLPLDNAVARIVACKPCLGGNSGEKLFIEVEYERPDPSLDTALFAKFSRYFPDAFRDRRRQELEPEVRLAALSRLPQFPVTVARAYFGDFDHAGGNGLLITQQVQFGQDGIEPMHVKAMDHELDNPLEYYEATFRALADLCAAHQSGRLSPQIDELFPFDRAAAEADMPIGLTEQQLRDKLAAIRTFVTTYPQLFASHVANNEFLDRFESDALLFLSNEDSIRRFLLADPRFVALMHWNTNIDNAWFWRDEDGTMQCGLLDWGMVRQMNVNYGLWGGVSVCDPAMLEHDLDGLLDLFARELAAQDGAQLDRADLDVHFDISVMLLCLALMLDCPAIVAPRVPELALTGDRHDARIRNDQVAHGFLNCFANCLEVWSRRNFGASLRAMLGERT